MLQRFSLNFAIFSVVVDALVIDLALWVVSYNRPLFNRLGFVQPINFPVVPPLVLFIVFPMTWILIMMSFDVYEGKKNLRVVDEFSSLTWSSVLAGVTMAGVLYFSYRDISRILFLSFVCLTYFLFLSWRVLARSLYQRRNRLANNKRHVLIVGMGAVGLDVARRIIDHKHFGLELVGFLDDDQNKRADTLNVFDSLDGIRRVVTQKSIDDVVIALPSRAHEKITQLVSILHDTAVRVWLIPDYFNLAMHHAQAEDFVGLPMFDLRAAALTQTQRWNKRVFDLVVTLILLMIVIPIMLVVAVCILIDDGRPVFLLQKRVGENGRSFKMIKFRTMVRGAEGLQVGLNKLDENGKLIHKHKDDPRITRVGGWLRKYSLDELPQFFNVLRGTMSLVGPRPELPFLVERYEPWQRKRFSVPQGITGWWQIHGRSDKPMHLHTEDDLYYIQNYSIWLDIEICIKTVWVVMRGKGAY